MTIEEIEAALDAGQIEALTTSGRWIKVRRNGRTKRWKRSPEHFCIPVKAGLWDCAHLGQETKGLYRASFGAERDFKVVPL